MDIECHDEIDNDCKKLKKRFPAPKESLEAWERFFIYKGLNETTGIKLYSGLGYKNIYKARIVPLKENVGKSKGYRLIFQIIDNKICKLLVFSRHGIYSSEQELNKIIKERLKLFLPDDR